VPFVPETAVSQSNKYHSGISRDLPIQIPAMSSLVGEFPIELVEHIASELETLRDVVSFSRVCNLFYTAVNCNQTVFRTLFLHLYERPRVPEGYDYKTAFRRRHSDVFEEDVLRDIILGKSAI